MNELAHAFTGCCLKRRLGRFGRWHMVLAALMFNLTAGAATADDGRKPFRIVALGDSLTAGYGVAPSEAFPAQLEKALRAKGHNVEILNAGVSGDTTAGGLQRFDWAVPEGTDAVILELGANDALRGIDPDLSRAALDKILGKLKARSIGKVLLAGMKAPSNWGADYVAKFDAMYPELAAKYQATLYPFFLDGVAQRPDLNQPDGLHPTAKGIAEIVSRILPSVESIITPRSEPKIPFGAQTKF
jgi:acyl-CoA thioesterase-1